MTLGVFGDSYAFTVSPTWSSWPSLLATHYDTEHYAMYGTSVWNSFKKFLNNHSKHTHIVFSYANSNRIHHLPSEIEHLQFSIFPTHIKNVVPKLYKKQMEAVWEAQKLTHDLQLDEYVNQHVFDDVNLLCKKNNIRLINLLPYENSGFNDYTTPLDLSNASGPCITGLRWVSDNELVKNPSDEADFRTCHLSPENNKILYEIILDLLNTDEQCTIHLKDSGLCVK